MKTKTLLATIATAATIAAPAAFASELYNGENDSIIAANTLVRATLAQSGEVSHGELYGFGPNAISAGTVVSGTSLSSGVATVAGGELYGFEGVSIAPSGNLAE